MAAAHMRRLLLLVFTGVFGLLAPLTGCTSSETSDGIVKIRINDRTFAMEVADDDASIERGLMGRTDIPEDEGMIFVWADSEPRRFWMKNCLTDIDLVFVDSMGRITAVHEMTKEPPRRGNESELAYERRLAGYDSGFPALIALEFRAGTIRELGLKPPQRLDLPMESLKARVR